MTNIELEDLHELAKGSIEQHLTDDVLCNAMEDTAKQTWEELEEMFASRSLSNKLFLKNELHSLRMKEGGNLMEHVSAFNRCIANLQRLGEVYKSEDNTVLSNRERSKFRAKNNCFECELKISLEEELSYIEREDKQRE
ncbi:hypothetical protein CerSpe_174580 [Prunus speciosa]